MIQFYYITPATGKNFIQQFTKYSLRSLLSTGVDPECIYCPVNNNKDKKLIKKLIPKIINIPIIGENLKSVVWTTLKGKRKFSLFKAAAMSKASPEIKNNDRIVCFDGDVLWYKNPTDFLISKSNKTWFHHGKDLQERCSIKKENINITNYDSLKRWVDPPMAYLMIKNKINVLPDREVVAGFYLLHPRDYQLLSLTYKYCRQISKRFAKGEGKTAVGEQKPFNAALCKLNVDWHGGSRFYCPEHKQYFDHFFGKKDMKKKFWKKVKKLGL